MNHASHEALLRRLQQLQAELKQLGSDIFYLGLDRQMVSSLSAHITHADYGIGFAETLLTRALRKATELEQVNGRA